MGGAISGAANAVSGVIGGIGAHKSASVQQQYQDEAMNQSRQGYADAKSYLNPYLSAGNDALSNLTWMVNNPDRRAQLLYDYYRGNEFNELANQARYQGLSAAEATGGLGSTAMSNQLASIAPTLAQNYLNTTYNQLQDLTGLGANTASNLAGIAVDRGNTMSGLYQQKGQIMAGKAALPYQVASSANSSIGNGMATDVNKFTGMFGSLMGGGY
ncbi:DNA transfer protein [Yersinia enterocolitica]|uniref:DNA transfer protein n=1 Tax=Yersinia enterocolitica TaxID=630 RepID=UPI003D079C58